MKVAVIRKKKMKIVKILVIHPSVILYRKCVIVKYVGKFEVKTQKKDKLPIKKISISENKIYPENQEKTACVEYSTVYSPPEELQIPENANKNVNELNPLMSDSTLSSSSNSDITSRLDSPSEDNHGLVPDLSGTILDIDSRSSSATITPVAKSFPK
jgi:hypothetical protein